MSRKNQYYFILIFLITNLHYEEAWGLNALLSALIFMVYHVLNPLIKPQISGAYVTAILLVLANGFAIFFTGHGPSTFWYLIALFFFLSIHYQAAESLPFSFAQGISNFFEGFYRLSLVLGARFQKKEAAKSGTGAFKFLIYLIPILIFIVFLKLYQAADETFYEWTKFINLDWISWSFIALFLLFSLFLYGFSFYQTNPELLQMEKSKKTIISPQQTDKLHTFLGIDTESKISMILLITLSCMLGLFLFIDLRVILFELPNPSSNFRYSRFLHSGVSSLITSIVLVIILVSVLFRGQLNFQQSKKMKVIAEIWLLLNLFVVITTVIKNYEYIIHWGLTYKRIGVYIYLLLAAIGLIFTGIKIAKTQTVWLLIRRTSFAFFICFTLCGFVNWDRMIVNYNLTALSADQIDFYYLSDLEDEAYPALMDYYAAHQNIALERMTYENWDILFTRYDQLRTHLKLKRDETTWRSYTYYEDHLSQRLESVYPIYLRFKHQ